MVIQFPLTKGLFALIDQEDLPKIQAWKWHISFRKRDHTMYAARSITLPDGRRSKIMMHRVILETPGFIDHKDRNGLNNTRENLRPATPGQNNHNIGKPKHGVTSRYKGASWHPKAQKFQATIRLNGKNIYLGLFRDEADAAWAYDRAARQLFGRFAACNFPPPPAILRSAA